MALDQSFVGRIYPPTDPYEVGREKIREFAEAVADANPVYTDPEAAKALGYADVIAPRPSCSPSPSRPRGRSSGTPSWASTTTAWCTATRSSPTGVRCAPVTGSRSPRPSRPSSPWLLQRHPGHPRRGPRRVRRARRDRLDQARRPRDGARSSGGAQGSRGARGREGVRNR